MVSIESFRHKVGKRGVRRPLPRLAELSTGRDETQDDALGHRHIPHMLVTLFAYIFASPISHCNLPGPSPSDVGVHTF